MRRIWKFIKITWYYRKALKGMKKSLKRMERGLEPVGWEDGVGAVPNRITKPLKPTNKRTVTRSAETTEDTIVGIPLMGVVPDGYGR